VGCLQEFKVAVASLCEQFSDNRCCVQQDEAGAFMLDGELSDGRGVALHGTSDWGMSHVYRPLESSPFTLHTLTVSDRNSAAVDSSDLESC
jgi:hypothetical protein